VDEFNSVIDAAGQLCDEPICSTGLGLGGTFFAECYGPDGVLKWRDHAKNIIPNTAIDNALNVLYAAGTPTTSRFMGMVDNAGFSAFAAADTMASHAGWTESTACSNATRPAWSPGAAASQSIANGTQVTFNINATATIKGFFLTSSATLGGTSGNLDATAGLTTPQAVASGDTLKVTYAINGSTT
jgi:hypothetical protein